MVEDTVFVVRCLLHVDARACFAEYFGALQGVDSVAYACRGASVDMAGAVKVVDMELFLAELRVDCRLDGVEHFFVAPAVREPEFAAVLGLRYGIAACTGEQACGRNGEDLIGS